MRISFTFIAVFVANVSMAAPFDSDVKAARECAANGDFDCTFEYLMTSAEIHDLPLVDTSNDQTFLTGAMLEDALIRASENWSPRLVKDASERYLSMLYQRYDRTRHLYATGHMMRATSCRQLGAEECEIQSVAALCANISSYSAPMGGHPNHQAFINGVAQLTAEECEG